jgi:hypothetical protein
MEELYRDKAEQQAAAAAAAAAEADGRPRVHVLTVEVDDVLVIDDDGQDGVVGRSTMSAISPRHLRHEVLRLL